MKTLPPWMIYAVSLPIMGWAYVETFARGIGRAHRDARREVGFEWDATKVHLYKARIIKTLRI